MNNAPFIIWIIFSAFTMNLVLQCGLGITSDTGKSIKGNRQYTYEWKSTLIKLGIIFFTVVLLWCIFTGIISSVSSGLFIYVLLFPVSFMVYEGLENLCFSFLYKNKTPSEYTINFPGGITAVALFICVIIADNFTEAVSLSFGFSFGTLLVFIIISEIRKRAELEDVPRFLRGKPLVLISMGLLSLIFTKASLIIFGMIGN